MYYITCSEKKSGEIRTPVQFMILTVSLILMTIMFFGCGKESDKKDPFEYLTVEFSGYNSNGSVEADLDYDGLIGSILGVQYDDIEDIEKLEDLEKAWEMLVQYDSYYQDIEVSCTPEEGLSNGDVVTVTIGVEGDAIEKVLSGQKTFVVEGLEELKSIDIFKDIEVSFDGLSGEASIHIERLSDNDIMNACQFALDKEYDFSIGDVVTVSISNVEELKNKYHYEPLEISKSYTVPALRHYLTDPSLLSIEDLRDFAERFVEEETQEDEEWFSYSETRYYNTYLFTKKNADYLFGEENNLMIVVTYDEYMNEEYWRTVYTYLEFRDIIVEADGTLSLSYEDGGCYSFVTDMNWLLEDLGQNYNITEINIEMPELHNKENEIVQEDSHNLINDFSADEQRTVNIFLSNFAEARLGAYPASDEELLRFAYTHCKLNTGYIEDVDSYNRRFSAGAVDETLIRFFDRTIDHRSMDIFEYKDDYYYLPAADGEFYGYFAIVHEMYQNEDGTYDVNYNVYRVSRGDEAGWEEDVSGYYGLSPEDVANYPALELVRTGTAVLRDYTKADGSASYQIVELN